VTRGGGGGGGGGADLLRRPGRLSRPERLVVVLRGLPGAGAAALRDASLFFLALIPTTL
jgi:hypothetical protein